MANFLQKVKIGTGTLIYWAGMVLGHIAVGLYLWMMFTSGVPHIWNMPFKFALRHIAHWLALGGVLYGWKNGYLGGMLVVVALVFRLTLDLIVTKTFFGDYFLLLMAAGLLMLVGGYIRGRR